MTNIVHELKKKIIDQIKSVFAASQRPLEITSNDFGHFELRQSLDLFVELAWLDTFKTNVFTIAKRRIEECLGYHLDETMENLFELKVDEKNSQNIPQASRMLLQINKKAQFLTHFEHFQSKTKQVDEVLAKINANLRLSFARIFLPTKDANNNRQSSFFLNIFGSQNENRIEADQNLICTQIDYDAVERCLVYLKACESIEMCDKNAIEKKLFDTFVQRQTALVQLLDKFFRLICTETVRAQRSTQS